ncbi:hypothetical protein FE783_04155 [Paenibacillus mesophilus]|uniref:hypothetical protein n=1 Tax=Paenibacillus mesophilus TaxID=2582849 RepID=UPI00110E401D|nr:hypothetical protein [Paenibacillus mesophilus]TMV52144.1 hypothetical protein FE783_04155 [Paenibacillus mesophilus]
MKQLLMITIFTVMLASGCSGHDRTGKKASLDPETKDEIARLLAIHTGKSAELQASGSIAEWTPGGRAKIQELLDGILPTLTVTARLPSGTKTDWAHVYARYEQDLILYFPVKTKNAERNIVAQVHDGWYSLTGDKQKVGQLLDWASAQSIY